MDTKGAKNRERIDLGLEALLARAEAPQEKEISIDLELSHGSSRSSSWTIGDASTTQQPPARNEFELLAAESKWTEIVRLAEGRLAHGDDLGVKLWWIRGHLGAFSMPVSFLSAPFDAVCKKLAPESVTDSLSPLLKETGLLVLQRLQEVGDTAHVNDVRGSLARLGIQEARGSRERSSTSSFRSLQSVSAEATAPTSAQHPSVGLPRSGQKRLVWTTVCLITVVALITIDRMFPHIRTPALDIASESFEQTPLDINQATELPGRRDPSGRLGALFYSIGEGTNTEPATARAAQSVKGPMPQSSPESQLAKTESSPPGPKEEVNTRGPIEGPEFRERVERGRIRPSASRREELQGGAPQAVLPGSSSRGGDDQRTYRVLNRASVVSAPSYGGRVIGQLEPGDRVLVEGRVGRWLRLRSKKGRGGYVLATDVEVVPELDVVSGR
ncbi:MAG: hypothetical protein RL518_353 [Pseudomonadota bacterium]